MKHVDVYIINAILVSVSLSGNNIEEISVRYLDAALLQDFFSKFYFDLKMSKMVLIGLTLLIVSISNCHLPNEVPFFTIQCMPFFSASRCCLT